MMFFHSGRRRKLSKTPPTSTPFTTQLKRRTSKFTVFFVEYNFVHKISPIFEILPIFLSNSKLWTISYKLIFTHTPQLCTHEKEMDSSRIGFIH